MNPEDSRPATPAKIQVLKTLSMTLAVLAKSTSDPDLRIAASQEEKAVNERLHKMEDEFSATAA